MEEQRVKEPVRLRRKAIKDGCFSLYLSIYYNGQRKYEYLRLYLIPARTKADHDRNDETLRLANAIKARRITEVEQGAYGFGVSPASKTRFFEYFKALIENKRTSVSKSLFSTWKATMNYLLKYETNHNITFADITKQWVAGFKEFLLMQTKHPQHPIATNTAWLYFNCLRSGITQAYKDDIIDNNPIKAVCSIRKDETTRLYLTTEEVHLLSDTDTDDNEVKRAFLFSCLTGLRKCDIIRLTWGEVQQQGDFTRLIFRQKKTRGQEYLDITPQAVTLLGTRGDDNDTIFHLKDTATIEEKIKRWCEKAGILKHITFHCARHTFAVMMLDLGVDIYTVSKLLGHKELTTTQIYAKVLDKNKQKAVSLIPTIL